MKAKPNKAKIIGVCAAAMAFLLMAAGSGADSEQTSQKTNDSSSQSTESDPSSEEKNESSSEESSDSDDSSQITTESSTDNKDESEQNSESDTESSETSSPSDEYYENTAAEILATEYANADNTMSEAEVSALFEEKGFNQNPITYEFDMNGTSIGETEVDKELDAKHPMYQTFYTAEAGDVWSIYIIGKAVYAYPLSYNYESDTEVEHIFGETDAVISYADDNNKFYTTIPKDSFVAYHVIEAVNAETIDKLTFEEVEKL